MRFLKKLFNFYINSSIHVALSVYSLTWITLLSLDLSYSESVLYFVFYASITGYNFVKYFAIAKFHHRQLANWLKFIQIVSFICFILMCFYAVQLSLKALTFILFLMLLTFFYATPFFSKSHTLRTIGGLKVYLIALVWASVTVFLPLVAIDYKISLDVIILGIQRFLLVVVLMLPFEIRDLKFDANELSTIPQKLGLKKTKLLGLLILLSFFLLEFFKDSTTENHIIAMIIIAVITGLFVKFSKVDQNKYYSSFWVEGIPILWLMLILIFN